MATAITTGRAAVLEGTPSALADGLDTLLQGLLEADRESAAVLATARDALRVLAWNRWVRTTQRSLRGGHMRRRHQHSGRHSTGEGRSHA